MEMKEINYQECWICADKNCPAHPAHDKEAK